MKLTDYLIASETNNYRPWITTPTALACFVLFTWGLRLFLPSLGIAAPSIDAYDLMSRINQERSNRFIPTLVTNTKLSNAAAIKSNDMLARNYFAHVNPDGQYVWPTVEAQGYTPYKTLGENLAMDFSDAAATVAAWMNSPTHRANILNEKYEDQGLAAIYGEFDTGHYSILTTSIFGALYKTNPPPPPPAPQPAQQPNPNPPPPAPKPPPPPPAPKPVPPPAPIPNPVPPPQPATPPPAPVSSNVSISDEINSVTENAEGKTLVKIEVYVSGNPQTVTATLEGNQTTLTAGSTTGQYLGEFTVKFPPTKESTVLVEAKGTDGLMISKTFPLTDPNNEIKVKPSATAEAQLSNTLKIILGIFSLCFLVFLLIDAYIIHRAKIQRTGISSSTHSVLFMLIAIVNILAVFYN